MKERPPASSGRPRSIAVRFEYEKGSELRVRKERALEGEEETRVAANDMEAIEGVAMEVTDRAERQKRKKKETR